MRQPVRILLIDDNPDERILIIRQLEQEFDELHVEQIVDAQELTQLINSENFDLVITDYHLIWTNGIEVLRAIKARYPEKPVVMFTNTGSEEIAVEAMKLGLDDYVIKSPEHYISLRVSVRNALERSQERKRSYLLDLRLQSLLERLNVGVFRALPDGRLLEANSAFLRLIGLDAFPTEQEVNLNDYALQIGSYSQSKPWERQVELERPDGSKVWVLLNESVSKFDGTILIDVLVEDITERVQAEMQIQQINATLEQRVIERTQQLEQANKDLETFAYSMSHDIREPLRTIHGFARVILEDFGESLGTVCQDYLQRIINGAKTLDELIQNLLIYSRFNRTDIVLQPVALDAVLNNALSQLEEVIQDKGVEITVEKPLPIVMGNYYMLIQIVLNLLSNAIKFVAPKTQPQIRIWAEEHEKNVCFWVQDNGIGIAPENQQRIFQTFTRLNGADFYQGSGIGLALVRKGVERMGGKVGVQSELEEGSRFWVKLLQYKEE
ncbi:response regulator [Nostocales cyanobacterium LEGE 11386]|nr:response regulator [Nostocales cyanobacterium LEGE 11386]